MRRLHFSRERRLPNLWRKRPADGACPHLVQPLIPLQDYSEEEEDEQQQLLRRQQQAAAASSRGVGGGAGSSAGTTGTGGFAYGAYPYPYEPAEPHGEGAFRPWAV